MKHKSLSVLLALLLVLMAPSCGALRIVFEGDPLAGSTTQQPGPDAKPAKPSRPGKPGDGKEATPPESKDQTGDTASSGDETSKDGWNGQVSDAQSVIIAAAKSRLGAKYGYGAAGPDTFDCSGLMYYAFRQAGITLPRNSGAQYSYGKKITKEELMPCDLIFFSGSKVSSTVGHVGMVLDYDKSSGKVTFIHSSSSNGVEIQYSTTDYYAKRYIGVCRVLQ